MENAKQHKAFVVEDNALVWKLLTIHLHSYGIEPVLARTMEEANKIIENPDFQPDIIGVDGNLWNGPNETLPLVRELLERYPHAILFTISGNLDTRMETARLAPERIQMSEKNEFPGRIAKILGLSIAA